MDTSKIFNECEDFEIFLYMSEATHVELDLQQQGRLYQAWLNYDKIQDYKEIVQDKLKDNFSIFANPLVEKINRLDLNSIFNSIEEFETLSDEKFKPVLSNIFYKKLIDLKESLKIKTFKTENVETYFGDIRYISYYKKADFRKYELFRLDLVFKGFKFEPKVYLFDITEEQTHLLTEQAMKNLKALMYVASENPTADFTVLEKGLKALEFTNPLLGILKDQMLKLE